jgi:hypothetical protein
MRPDTAHKTSGNLISNNAISYTGRDYYDSAAIFVGFTTGIVITHNTISYTPWRGIAIGWGWGLLTKEAFLDFRPRFPVCGERTVRQP